DVLLLGDRRWRRRLLLRRFAPLRWNLAFFGHRRWRRRFLLGRFAPLRWTLPLLGDRRWRRRIPLRRRGFTLLHRLHWRRGGGPVFRQRRRRHILGSGWTCDDTRGRGCRGPRHAAPRQTALIEAQPILFAARGRGIRGLGAGDDQLLEGVRKQRQHAHQTCHGNQGGGGHKTQVRIQGPSPSSGVSAPHPAQRQRRLWRDYVRAMGRGPPEVGTRFNRTRPPPPPPAPPRGGEQMADTPPAGGPRHKKSAQEHATPPT